MRGEFSISVLKRSLSTDITFRYAISLRWKEGFVRDILQCTAILSEIAGSVTQKLELKLFNSWLGFFCSFAVINSHKSLENYWNYEFKGINNILPPEWVKYMVKFKEFITSIVFETFSTIK